MAPIQDYIKHLFSLIVVRGRIIHLHAEGYRQEKRKVPFDTFARYCWLPAYYDSDECYDQIGVFVGHEEMKKDFWCGLS